MSWKHVCLADYVDLISGPAFKSANFTDDPADIPLVKGDNLAQGYVNWNKSKFWPRSDAESYSKYWLHEGDVILAMDRPWVTAGLKYSWIKGHDPEAFVVQRVARMRGRSGLLSEYLRYIVGSRAFSDYIKNIMGGTNVPHISPKQISAYKISLPSEKTQTEIVKILSNYDDLIENNKRRIALLEESARQLYKEWFVHFRFPGHEHVKIVDGSPQGWVFGTFGDVFDFLGGYPFKSKSYIEDGKYGVVTIKNVHDSRFVPDVPSRIDHIPDKMKTHCKLSTGDILLSLTGNVGRACVLYGDNYLLNQRVTKIKVKFLMTKEFAYWTFTNKRIQRRIENLAHGAAQLNLSPVKLSGLDFIIPPSNLINAFSDITAPIFQQILKLNLTNQELAKARDLLLPKLMSGELAV